MTAAVPAGRIAVCNHAPVRADGDYVLYWMIAPRRTTWNFGLQHAVHRARELGRTRTHSYSGIFWVLGRFDRAWGPERPIYGTVRYMTSENTARKFDVADYVRRYSPALL